MALRRAEIDHPPAGRPHALPGTIAGSRCPYSRTPPGASTLGRTGSSTGTLHVPLSLPRERKSTSALPGASQRPSMEKHDPYLDFALFVNVPGSQRTFLNRSAPDQGPILRNTCRAVVRRLAVTSRSRCDCLPGRHRDPPVRRFPVAAPPPRPSGSAGHARGRSRRHRRTQASPGRRHHPGGAA